MALCDTVQRQIGIYLHVPSGFRKNKSCKNFWWMSEETPKTSKGLFIYTFDYAGEGTFSNVFLLNKRDSVLRKNVPGPEPGSFMATELKFPPIYKKDSINGIETVEMRGLWKVNGHLMGGPFIMHAHHNPETNKVVVTEGYVYAPEKPEKRNSMRELEAILYSYRQKKTE